MIYNVHKSLNIEGLLFPQRKDYLSHFGISSVEAGIPLNIDSATVISIQRDWHARGQNGCMFAMYAARHFSQIEWSSTVIDQLPTSNVIRSDLENAVNDADNKLHSFIFPNVITKEQVEELVNLFISAGCIVRKKSDEVYTLIRLRWLLGEIESWVIGFSPVEELPTTRRSPFTELIFSTKKKIKIIHPQLNNDPMQAHVADLDLGFKVDAIGRLMKRSSQHTARILGGMAARTNNHSAKAKTTYGFKRNKDSRKNRKGSHERD